MLSLVSLPSRADRRIAPSFSLEAVVPGRSDISLAQVAGRPLIINFWASWCVPCRKEMPALQAIHERNPRIAVIGINTADQRSEAQSFLGVAGVSYPTGFDPSGSVGRAFRIFGMPTTVMVSTSGRVLETFHGEVTRSELQGRIDAYSQSQLNEADPNGRTRVPLGSFAALVNRATGTPIAWLSLLALGLAFGALHALGPGHGKTMMAAYLIGAEGTARDAVLLGTIVSLMHTGSVIVLGVLLSQLDRPLEGESAYRALSLGLGVAVAAVGVRLLVHQLDDDTHSHTGETAKSGHSTGDGDAHPGRLGTHRHSHEIPEGATPLSRRGLVALALSGGLFPSPSALILLVTSIALGRTALGLALIAAFSVGLAVTLTAVGLGIVYGRRVAERRGYHAAVRYLPLVGASWLVVMGLALVLRSARVI